MSLPTPTILNFERTSKNPEESKIIGDKFIFHSPASSSNMQKDLNACL